MNRKLPASSQKCREARPARAALQTRPSGRSRLLRNDPSTISSPAPAAADPDKPGRPRSDRQPNNHSPPALTSTRVQISGTLRSARKMTRSLAPPADGDRRSASEEVARDDPVSRIPRKRASAVSTSSRVDTRNARRRQRRPVRCRNQLQRHAPPVGSDLPCSNDRGPNRRERDRVQSRRPRSGAHRIAPSQNASTVETGHIADGWIAGPIRGMKMHGEVSVWARS